MARSAPNVLVTGTPGTGKTSLSEQVAAATGLKHLNIGDLVKSQQLHTGWDDEFECLVIDEDKVRRNDGLSACRSAACRRRSHSLARPAQHAGIWCCRCAMH
jgi:broad-specificity NMP kinase